MGKTLTSYLTLFLIFSVLAVTGCGSQEEITTLEEDLASAEALAAGFKSERNDAQAEAKELERRLRALRVQIDDLRIIVDDQQAQIDELNQAELPPPDTETCNPAYDQCLDPMVSDYDCASGTGDGPLYVEGPIGVRVIGDDPYRLDADYNGIGCE